MEKVNFDLEELHQVQLGMLEKLIEVCEENRLTYFLAFGSLLGAVRNHKIIEWDDSIDVVMPYEDYVTLTKLPQNTWGSDLFMQTYDSDSQYPRIYAKLRNSSTTLIKADYAKYDMNHGIYINIMPLVRLADDKGKRAKQIRAARLYKALTEETPVSTGSLFLRLYSKLLLNTSDRQKLKRLRETYKEIAVCAGAENTESCFVLAANKSLELVLSQEWFVSAIDWEFEGWTVRIPAGWKEWLTLRYGDYTQVPITELQSDKISKFVTLNTHKSYVDYKGKTYCVEG